MKLMDLMFWTGVGLIFTGLAWYAVIFLGWYLSLLERRKKPKRSMKGSQ